LQTCRYTYLFDLSLRQGYPLLLVGPTGTGKTTIVTRHLLGNGGSGGGGGGGAAQSEGDGGEGGGAGQPQAAPALVGGLAADKWVPVFLTLSARTTANMAQEQVGEGRATEWLAMSMCVGVWARCGWVFRTRA
jgi:dynein heavy chain